MQVGVFGCVCYSLCVCAARWRWALMLALSPVLSMVRCVFLAVAPTANLVLPRCHAAPGVATTSASWACMLARRA
jgi:hypothetical protein